MISAKSAKKRPRKSAVDDDEDYNDMADGMQDGDHDIYADDVRIGGKKGKKGAVIGKGKVGKASVGSRGKNSSWGCRCLVYPTKYPKGSTLYHWNDFDLKSHYDDKILGVILY